MSFPGLYNEVTHARNPPKTINTSTVPCAAVLTHTRNTSTSNWCTPSTILKLILLLYLFTYVFVPIVPTARARTIPTAVQHALRTAIPTYYNTADIRTYIYYVLKKKVLLQGEDRYVLHLLTFCTQVTHLFLRMYVLNVPTVDASTYLVPGILFSLLFFLFHPIYCYLRPSFSLSLLVVTEILGHIAGSTPTSPLRFVPCILSREDFSSFFPGRLTSNCAYLARRSQQQRLILFLFCKWVLKIQ